MERERATSEKKSRKQLINSVGTFVVGMVCGALLVAMLGKRTPVQPVPASAATRPVTPNAAPTASMPPSLSTPITMPSPQQNLPTRTGAPWEYDAPTNSHFNPLPGHNHWHAGPAPDEATRASMAAQPAPVTLTPASAFPPPPPQ